MQSCIFIYIYIYIAILAELHVKQESFPTNEIATLIPCGMHAGPQELKQLFNGHANYSYI